MVFNQNLYKVIVIGGGVSGLAAIQRLIKKEIKNCLLVEAQDHLGGRVSTVVHGAHYLEYGAHWVHGEEGNIVYTMAKEHNHLDEEPSFKQTGIGETVFIQEDSSLIPEATVQGFQMLMANLTEEGEKELHLHKESIGKYYTKKFIEKNKWGSVGLELLDWYGRFQCCIDGSSTWFEPSGVGSTVYQECPGNSIINWTKGYHCLIDYLKEGVPDEVFQLNSPVRRIIWKHPHSDLTRNDGPHVRVDLDSGEVLFGEHVIFTPSLAVLKSTHDSLFDPPLPYRKVEAIEGLGIDVVDKIFIEFPSRWWGDTDGFSFLKTTPHYEFDQQNWEEGILGFYEVYKQPQMLCAWITGSAAREMEKSSLEDVKNRCMNLIKRYLSLHYTIPDPIWCDRSTWGSNCYVQGSYSFRSVTSEVKEVTAQDLASPLCSEEGIPLVCFAGEATHDHFYSTVHGAVESGWREADRIVDLHLRLGQSPRKSKQRCFDVVIVGAGASGLAAAKELEANGIESIVILEALDRIGGRVQTVTFPSGEFIDLGAQWIHGQLENSLYEISAPRGLIGSAISVDGEGDFYTDQGEKLDDGLVNETLSLCSDLKNECRSFVTNDLMPPPSFGDFYSSRFEEYLNEAEECSVKKRQLRKALYHWDVRWVRIDNACDSLQQVSAKRWGDFTSSDGFYNMNPKFGMSSLLDNIRNDVKAEVHLSTEVIEIDYATHVIRQNAVNFVRRDGSSPIVIICRNGERYECNHVIITCSLGFLKNNMDTLFRPTLPTFLSTAISTTGYGVIDKIFLEFEKPFWGPDFSGMHLVWTEEEIPDFARQEPGTKLLNGRELKPEDFWYKAITSFDPVYGHKSVLCGWIGGAEGQYMESLPEEEVARVCVALMKKFTNDDTIPLPIRIYRSQWATNHLFRGSYSYRSCEGDRSEIDVLKALNTPVYATSPDNLKVPMVTIAGEANSRHFYSTIHGALDSGTSQTRHYINHLKRLKKRSENEIKSQL